MSHEYRENLERRVKAGKAPHMEVLLNHYAFGRPRAETEIQPPKGATLGKAMKIPRVGQLVQLLLPSRQGALRIDGHPGSQARPSGTPAEAR